MASIPSRYEVGDSQSDRKDEVWGLLSRGAAIMLFRAGEPSDSICSLVRCTQAQLKEQFPNPPV